MADFGSSFQIGKNGLIKAESPVGTPGYVAPEVLQCLEGKTHGLDCDWWSLGIVFYEMLFNVAPFENDGVMSNAVILNWKKFFKIPTDVPISPEAQDLLTR